MKGQAKKARHPNPDFGQCLLNSTMERLSTTTFHQIKCSQFNTFGRVSLFFLASSSFLLYSVPVLGADVWLEVGFTRIRTLRIRVSGRGVTGFHETEAWELLSIIQKSFWSSFHFCCVETVCQSLNWDCHYSWQNLPSPRYFQHSKNM